MKRLQSMLEQRGVSKRDVTALAQYLEQSEEAGGSHLHVNHLELNNPVEQMKVKDLVEVGNYMHLNKDTAKFMLASRILCYQNQRQLVRNLRSEQCSRKASAALARQQARPSSVPENQRVLVMEFPTLNSARSSNEELPTHKRSVGSNCDLAAVDSEQQETEIEKTP